MSVGLYSHTTRATGTLLTAAIYNSDNQNHITNQNPSATGGYSDSVGQMQTVTDPGGVGSESLASHLAGELERLRFCIKRIVGGAQWYSAPVSDLSDIDSPANFTVTQTFKATGDLTPAQINSDQSNYAPTGHATAFTFRLSSDAVRSITGLQGGAAGRIIELVNVGSNLINITHEDALSSAANRFALNSGQAPLSLSAGESMLFKYDGTLSRWRPMASADMSNPSFVNETLSGFQDVGEMTPPANPAANFLRHFAKDVSGTTIPTWLDSAGADPTIPARAYAEYTTSEDITAVIPYDDTIPQNTEGTELVWTSGSNQITLKRPNSRVRVRFAGWGWCESSGLDDNRPWIAALFKGSDADALQAVPSGVETNNVGTGPTSPAFLEFEHAPGSVGPHTYKIRVGVTGSGNSLRTNGEMDLTAGRLFGGASRATLVIEEIFVP